MSTSANPARPHQWTEFCDLWCQTVASVLGQISGQKFSGALCDLPADSQADTVPFWFVVGVEQGANGQFSFALEQPVALAFAQLLMGEAVDTSIDFSQDHLDAVAELVRQFCGSFSVTLKARFGKETPVRLLGMETPAWKPALECRLNFSTSTDSVFSTRAGISAELGGSLTGSIAAAPATNSAAAGADSPAAMPEAQSAAVQADDGRDVNLRLLRSVCLETRLTFGESRMALSDVLGFVPGTVIESDRSSEMPVDMWVEGVLTARGDIVIVEGNYGLRVRELVHPEARKSALSKGSLLAG